LPARPKNWQGSHGPDIVGDSPTDITGLRAGYPAWADEYGSGSIDTEVIAQLVALKERATVRQLPRGGREPALAGKLFDAAKINRPHAAAIGDTGNGQFYGNHRVAWCGMTAVLTLDERSLHTVAKPHGHL
jgi:hypothetical protein